ncbi:unnamed protein product, partial [Prorocentrum cordatum]
MRVRNLQDACSGPVGTGAVRAREVKRSKDGIDLHFSRDKHAQEFLAFVKSWAVTRHHDSKHLVSHNQNNNSYRFKRTTCVELCPVSRDDLVMLPPKNGPGAGRPAAFHAVRPGERRRGPRGPSQLQDGGGLRRRVLEAAVRRRLLRQHLIEFVVLDVVEEEDGPPDGHAGPGRVAVPCEVEVARSSDFGRNDERLLVRSHLGGRLRPGDVALGFDLRTLNTGVDDE